MTQETFERELARRADDVHGAPLTLADVRGRARGIQRRRRAAMAGAVAAVVALVVVVPSIMAGGHDKGKPEPAPPVPGHTAFLHGGTVTMPDTSTVDIGVDSADVMELGVLSDGRIVLALQKPYTVRVYSADGSGHTDYPVAANVITMSARDDAAAWVADDNTVRVLSSGVAEPATLPGRVTGSIDAVLDAEHLLVGDSPTTTGELTPNGIEPLEAPEQFRVIDVNARGDLWAVSFVPTAQHEDGGCSGLYDPQTREVLARSCSAYSLTFAPDGQHVLSTYHENNMVGAVKVLDLELKPVTTFEPDGDSAAVSRIAWEDSEHLIAGVSDWRKPAWTLERIGLDGSSVVVQGPEDGGNPEETAAFVLSE